MIINRPMKVRQISGGWNVQYAIYNFYTTSGSPSFVHFKTNVACSGNAIVMIEARGYNYGRACATRCSWQFYAWNNNLYNKGMSTPIPGMDAYSMYKSSDGYACIIAYATSHYFNGFILDAYSHTAYPANVDILASVQTDQSGAYY